MSKRILILAATTGYQTRVFEEAARALGLDVVMATDRCRHMDDPWGDQALPVRFQKPVSSAELLARLEPRPDGVIAVGDRPTELAALVAEQMGLRYHTPSAVIAARNKLLARERFRAAGLLVPEYYAVGLKVGAEEAIRRARFPCVLKPLGLSGSRGVIRADSPAEFTRAYTRIAALLQRHEIERLNEEQDHFIQVETYVPGREYAIEGLVSDGRLKVLALFDKPDPLDGPFFEETIYVTPSREPEHVRLALVRTAQEAVTALGLTDGPLHAEMRHNEQGVWMLEAAARPIGGLCARALRFSRGMSLEQLLLRFALGEDVSGVEREPQASGVMMIPIPQSGIYSGVEGVDAAASVEGIEDVQVTAKQGQRLEKLPEGASYLGFIFARAETPQRVEEALRQSHSRLRFTIMAELPALNNSGPNY
jgi:hypothetical protein